MNVRVHMQGTLAKGKTIAIGGSKSETNRLLLLQALYPSIQICNASGSDDSRVMRQSLTSGAAVIDVHHAGTAMRFLTAYFAQLEGSEVILTGSSRMRERPIGILVDALRTLGADIDYLEKDGFPPLKIKGKALLAGEVTLNANVSSQFITALLLIAPKLVAGLELRLEGDITSRPYLEMTVSLLRELGFNIAFIENTITVSPQSEIPGVKSEIEIESDWSSASYFYSIVALSPVGTSLSLTSFKQNSLQGDSALIEIYNLFGVGTIFSGNQITLTKISNPQQQTINLGLNNTPDIAQTIAVTCFGLGIACNLTGLHTLKIKETDRLTALKKELEKLGAELEITDDSLVLAPAKGINNGVTIETYNDHRMAMAFAPLAIKEPITIRDADVVSKSYPAFWEDINSLGISVDRG